ncbi:MAG TPA: MltA domain-containing protein, partial [Candidatus Caenarcaniphilales bacterium]
MLKTAVGLIVMEVGLIISTLPALAVPPLRATTQAQLQKQPCLGMDEQIGAPPGSSDRTALLAAIDHSLRYLKTPLATAHYRNYPVPGVTRERVQRSLMRFRQLLQQTRSTAELQAAVKQEFTFYQSVGKDNQGTVAFTGYFEPTYVASRVPTQTYRYPLYRVPPRLHQWPHPHPSRSQLEGLDGLQGANGLLRG